LSAQFPPPKATALTADILRSAELEDLEMRVVAGESGFGRPIAWGRIQRPGLALAGFLPYIKPGRIQILGESELNYLDIPLTIPSGKKGQTFTVSNILPVELGGKSYVWSCQVDVVPNKPNKLIIPDINKPRKTCDVVVKDLTVCKAGGCDQK